MPRKRSEKLNKVCKYCKELFITARKNQLYCCRACKDGDVKKLRQQNAEIRAAKKRLRRSELFDKSTFCRYLVVEVMRAGTAQIVQGLTLEELLILRDIVALRSVFNASNAREYALSHIQPVSQPEYIGTLHPSNLVIAPSAFNTSRRNKAPSNPLVGHRISRGTLDPTLRVKQSDHTATIIKQIKKAIGDQVFNAFIAEAKLALTAQHRLQKHLDKLGIEYDKNAPVTHLQDLLEEYTGKRIQLSSTQTSAPLEYVVMHELKRLSPYNPFVMYLKALNNFYQSYTVKRRFELQAFILKQAIRYLHSDPYDLSFDGKAFLSYFTLDRTPSKAVLESNPFIALLHEEGRYVSKAEAEAKAAHEAYLEANDLLPWDCPQ